MTYLLVYSDGRCADVESYSLVTEAIYEMRKQFCEVTGDSPDEILKQKELNGYYEATGSPGGRWVAEYSAAFHENGGWDYTWGIFAQNEKGVII